MHLMISLFAYDALYTFVLLSQCALFAEMSVKHEDRLRLIKYNQVASVLGNCSIFITGVVSNNMENLFNLQLCCIFIAAISWLFIRYCALNTTTLYDNHITPKKQKDSSGSENGYKIKNHDDEMSFKAACQITWQILCNKNFLSFVIMNFFQVLHQTFGTNFLLIFADHLIPKYALSSFERSFIYGASFILPQVVIILSGSIIEKYGSFRIIMATFYAQIFFAIAQYFIGRNHYYFVALYLVLETTLPSIAANFTSINIADVIDEDMAIHNLKLPRSSMIFGTNALVTKPAISLAPMIVVFILNRYDYDSLKESGIIKEEFSSKDAIQPDTIAIDQLHSVMFNFMCYFPIVLSIIRIFVWNRFQLRSSHKKDAKYADNGELY
uniref:transmembrane protein 180-like isoform X1 n=1 Tax=Styela clava TaxID=7725 RepID=UPI0019393AD6|nr:transmembrane protein 180-like isoform X1 [Styela clava]